MVKATQEQLAQMQAVITLLDKEKLVPNQHGKYSEQSLATVFHVIASQRTGGRLEKMEALAPHLPAVDAALRQAHKTQELPIQLDSNTPEQRKVAFAMGITDLCLDIKVPTASSQGTIAQGGQGILID